MNEYGFDQIEFGPNQIEFEPPNFNNIILMNYHFCLIIKKCMNLET